MSYTTPTAKSKSFIAVEPVIEIRAQVLGLFCCGCGGVMMGYWLVMVISW